MKIQSAKIESSHYINGATVICPYCDSKQDIPMEENGMNKAFKRNCGTCHLIFKVDIPSIFKNFHPVIIIKP